MTKAVIDVAEAVYTYQEKRAFIVSYTFLGCIDKALSAIELSERIISQLRLKLLEWGFQVAGHLIERFDQHTGFIDIARPWHATVPVTVGKALCSISGGGNWLGYSVKGN